MNWKRYLLPSALILAFGLTVGIAQNINKALQLSQDPTGAFGVDTNNNVYFPGHQLTTGPGTPVVTACGGSTTTPGTDTAGTMVSASNNTPGCVITFSKAYLATPYCLVTTENPGTSPPAYSASTTAITITSTTLGSATVHWYCSGSR